jgi:acyl carrier protein
MLRSDKKRLMDSVLVSVSQLAKAKSFRSEDIDESSRLVEDIGFESLDLARLVAILDFQTGLDPFSALVAVTSVRTVGDLCEAYAKAYEQGDLNRSDSR